MVSRSVLLVATWLFLHTTLALADPGLRIVVWKSKRELLLLKDGEVIRRYPISLGRSPKGPKRSIGDMKTPVGRYFVVEKRSGDETRYHRFLAINYPELADADLALEEGRITADVWADIWLASKRRQKPPHDTPLGAFLGIHGTGAEGRDARLREVIDWTQGCIALTDRNVEELYRIVPVGTPVDIHE